ncbi:baculoviral IAP repeat-containing protein 3 isoform X2 [Patella vulgata]|uniref:baculoviral IAP repeat-containing protein 3 isoform X2 n=1 Tax=Patella vulgata TaxID=6465 RepID=UPI00217F408E|nr:baculoviral IAP repeat-containing protein 3 isoform X2 [Patella vulgata]
MEGSYFPLSNILGRLASFDKLPNRELVSDSDRSTRVENISVSNRTSLSKLARAGFYFDQTEGSIRCFCCKVEYGNWEKESPVAVHRILNPECPYLTQTDRTNENTTLTQIEDQHPFTGIRRALFPSDCRRNNYIRCTESQQPSATETTDNQAVADEFREGPNISSDIGQLDYLINRYIGLIRGDETPPTTTRRTRQSVSRDHVDEYSGKIIRPIVGDVHFICFESFRLLTFSDPINPRSVEWAKNGFMAHGRDQVMCVYCGECAAFAETSSVKGIHQRISPAGRYCCPMVSGIDVGDVSRDLEKQVREKLINHNNVQPSSCSTSYPVLQPQYKAYEKRLTSFKYWPKYYHVTSEDLANAGFFYTGAGTKVVCFCCGVAIREWEREADPLQQHALVSPSCEFIQHQHGQSFINRMKNIKKLVELDPKVTAPVQRIGELNVPDPYPVTMDMTLLTAYSSCGKYPDVPMLKAAMLANGELKQKDDMLEKNFQVIDRLDHVINRNDRHYRERLALVNQQYTQEINNKDQQLNHTKQHFQQELNHKDQQLNHTKQELNHKDQELNHKDQELNHKDELRQHEHQILEEELKLRDNHINRLSELIQTQRNEQIERENNLMRERNETVMMLTDYQTEIERHNEEIERQKEEIERDIEKYKQEISSLAAEYSRLQTQVSNGNNIDVVPAPSEELTSERICRVCLTEEKVVLFRPCRHVCCCTKCAPRFVGQSCPICRSNVDQWEVVFVV